MTSAANSPSPAAVAVRQAPLTATESPGSSSEARPARMRRRAPRSEVSTASIRPSSAMIPVNIRRASRSPFPEPRADEQVLAHGLELRRQGSNTVRDPDGALSLQDGSGLGGADQERGDEEADLVDLARVEQRACERRPALDEEVLDLP